MQRKSRGGSADERNGSSATACGEGCARHGCEQRHRPGTRHSSPDAALGSWALIGSLPERGSGHRVHRRLRRGSNDSPIWEEMWENWVRSLALNLEAPFALSQLVAQDIRAAGWRRIVMVSATAGDTGAPSMSPYCAAKHGVIGLMRSLAQALASAGAICNALLPGWVRTEMADRMPRRKRRAAECRPRRSGRSVRQIIRADGCWRPTKLRW
jgi:NAD(P)-dependent dehydrogenase (short-subunit alcohol dehydrogenase family)